MGFWNRKTRDPLLDLMLEKYNLNLLSIPRENASVGDLYMQEGNLQRISTPGNVSNFLRGQFQMPAVRTGETMGDVSGTTSRDASGKAGINFLEGFLNALGPAGLGTKVKGSYEGRSLSKITFTFQNPTRDYVDAFDLGKKLIDHTIMEENALYGKDRRYYIVTAVAKSPSISILTEGNSKQLVDIDVEVMKVVDASGGVSVENKAAGQVTFKGSKNLAFGVELYDLKYINKGESSRFQMGPINSPIVARGSQERENFIAMSRPAELLDPDENISLIS
jgi:hypothetical protein